MEWVHNSICNGAYILFYYLFHELTKITLAISVVWNLLNNSVDKELQLQASVFGVQTFKMLKKSFQVFSILQVCSCLRLLKFLSHACLISCGFLSHFHLLIERREELRSHLRANIIERKLVNYIVDWNTFVSFLWPFYFIPNLHGFQVRCRNKQRNFTNNQTSCSRNTRCSKFGLEVFKQVKLSLSIRRFWGK